jgi:hypothetical protein
VIAAARMSWAAKHAELASAPKISNFLTTLLASPTLPRWGQWLEFGVASGGTLRQLAAARGEAKLFGFDSFRGLPQRWRDHRVGEYASEPPKVEGAELVVGLFEETLPHFTFGQVTLVHIDCDLYSSAVSVLEAIRPHLVPGHAILTFDELLDYPGHEEHELRALGEAFEAGMRFDWIARGDGPFDKERAAILVW